MKKFRKFSGQLFLCYGMWYGLERMAVEGLRTDSLYLGSTGIRVSQLLSLVLALVMGLRLLQQRRRPHPPEALFVNRSQAESSEGGE